MPRLLPFIDPILANELLECGMSWPSRPAKPVSPPSSHLLRSQYVLTNVEPNRLNKSKLQLVEPSSGGIEVVLQRG
jgi:hypothetical protein